ncbi:MAG: preprotein translocase subunit TatB [Candidatus Portnoybacteria bacterium CG_4_8_14_3_um_filter_44_10]|uniref:Preprotein translocase subunit TatB n=5 Tax=Candidatus Portnoyibacteriota TaxID=1817913 RepID=A0A2H0KRD4_9BACT|nr:MAG: preprotein translocase subunit TatB [Candidatus Portnoybacteria bacterium CG11_big_fil_rev_8_21_14_0_20_44_10]PIS16290.1 MAG: preprotein translocase subunit TatB [Candidatus Portnoybacteria bacterium CG09_land_8_20_14_0_10_44_13]PIW75730.1 MAG: preprotein translocase subunit TatB [Candidatus Portnoybacteria bacterium CG_4_8_14_3_um_filter_44_10]PIZ68726.1 MAG: preprotein translocase subunit TatB [Candidatus Portnoybacteria bacterium CG_4_10_14_0_2_um_filter_44_20]
MPKNHVDTRGLPCPEPVLRVMEKIRTADDLAEIVVLVDANREGPKENTKRTAAALGWQAKSISVEEEKEEEEYFKIVFEKIKPE